MVVTVNTAAKSVTFNASSEALAIELHAFRIATVAEFLLAAFLWLLVRIHNLLFKFKLYL